jgi:cellulose biosynthesis protein BcsQ
LAENVFAAADVIVVPLIPTTLSLMAHKQLLDFLVGNGYQTSQVYAFFSMVDGRKKLHRELIAQARGDYEHVLDAAIPYLSHVEQMGVYRAPVGVFAPSSPAAAAYEQLWQELGGAITR